MFDQTRPCLSKIRDVSSKTDRLLSRKKGIRITPNALSSASDGNLSDKQLFFGINAVDLFRCGCEQDLEALFDAGHNGGYLACRDDDLLIDELSRIRHLHVSPIDGLA